VLIRWMSERLPDLKVIFRLGTAIAWPESERLIYALQEAGFATHYGYGLGSGQQKPVGGWVATWAGGAAGRAQGS
jgi:hypothetical protein